MDERARDETGELCIVGAGVAGLNALFAASRYLTKRHRVFLIEANPSVGGMWTETYDYVRLHQPHPMFTAGNIPWTLGREPSHLASKSEVLSHFEHCLATLRGRVELVECFGYRYLEHREVPVGEGYGAEVICRAVGGDRSTLRIRTNRLIKAFGYRIPQNEPLALASAAVRSVSPHSDAFLGAEMDADDRPVYVVGGGKTGMDTAHELIRRYPGRRVSLVAGAGTVFANRNRGFPIGAKRWFGGITGFRMFRDLALTFNGDNEVEVVELLKRRYGIAPHPDCQQYMFGVLSEEENAAITQGVDELILDYVSDVVDRDGGPHILFRSGATRAVEPGSWVVNCTGHLIRVEHPYEPYLSKHGAVLSIQPTSAVHFLTTVASYFLAHLFFLGKLETLPLYQLDQQGLAAKSRRVWSSACSTLSFYNTLLILGAVPSRVMREFGLNFDLWYPVHRRLYDFAVLKRHGARYAAHCRRALERVRERFGVECGVLPHVAARNRADQATAA